MTVFSDSKIIFASHINVEHSHEVVGLADLN